MKAKMAKRMLRLVTGIALAALFLWLTLRQISLAEIKRAFLGASFMWVAAALAAFAAGYSCRIKRWHLMLQADNSRLQWRSCAGPFLASFAANNVLPFRAGDVLRSFAFNQQLGTTSGVMIATLFVERLLDLLTVLIFLGAALAFFGVESVRFARVGSAVLILGGMVLLIILLFPHLFKPVSLVFGRMVERIAPTLGHKLLSEIDKSFMILQHLSKGSTMIRLAFWSLTVWLAEGCVFWFSALALPAINAPLAGWLALPVSTLATLIPSTPGYVGTFDFFTVRAMTELGNNTGAATAYALLIHALLWLPPTLAGGLYLLLHPVSTTQASVTQEL
ncbi:MAG: lysylphosphatidylglycerol synthase transmembrane domain-containing protein [Desulfobulbaceae bacterium]